MFEGTSSFFSLLLSDLLEFNFCCGSDAMLRFILIGMHATFALYVQFS